MEGGKFTINLSSKCLVFRICEDLMQLNIMTTHLKAPFSTEYKAFTG